MHLDHLVKLFIYVVQETYWGAWKAHISGIQVPAQHQPWSGDYTRLEIYILEKINNFNHDQEM